MPFVKLVKDKAYHKRFQVKYRRRREAKTDYQQRRRLVIQDKNKYASPKYRFVVRRTNTKIICQVVYATIQGDKVLCQALSKELISYGLTAGLTNYAACYATGLLCARRLLAKLKMSELYKGEEQATGAYFDVFKTAAGQERRPFKAFLDVGMTRTTVGNRVFGALKGACDGGLCIPHSKNIFPGYRKEEKKEVFDVNQHRDHIFGIHVQNYMDHVKEESGADKQKSQFSAWIKCMAANKVDSLEELYKKLHAAIRAHPEFKKKEVKKQVARKYLDARRSIIQTTKGKYRRDRRLTHDERKKKVQDQIDAAMKQIEIAKAAAAAAPAAAATSA
ncbi:MAG: hypothetical protein P4L10_17540 [Acidobacteriaceae bacterium]|nr:hypothetical protein [Acidobacteriaceae bacterium]